MMNNSAVFNISDSLIRNMKRSLVPVSLFVPEGENNNLLFIDGNQKFFRNPVIGFFKNSISLDPISKSNVDLLRSTDKIHQELSTLAVPWHHAILYMNQQET